MAVERSLSRRITLWVMLYMLVLSVVVIALGNSINERAERMVWKSMLHSEIDHFDRREGRFYPFVARFSAGAIQRVFHRRTR